MAAAAEPKKTTGVVRGTIEYASGIAFGLYNRVEQYTVVKATVNLTKPFEPVVKKAVAIADPWVDSVDSYATPAWKNVNAKVIEPATLTLTKSYTAVLDFSDRAVDTVLPDTEKDPSKIEKKEQEKSIVQLSNKTQTRIVKRAQKGWTDLRAFSAGRLKEIIHIDIIEYAESKYALTVTLAQKHIVPIYKDLSARGSAIAASSKSIYVEKSKVVKDTVAKYQEITYQRYNAAYKFASDKAEEFGVPAIVGKAKQVSLGEVSDFVLVKLNIKHQNEQYVVAEKKIVDLIRTLVGLIIAKPAKQQSAPASQPASANAAH